MIKSISALAFIGAFLPSTVKSQVATQQCAYALNYAQSVSDSNGYITATFTASAGGYASELHHVQLHVSKNCKASMAADSTYDGPNLATTNITSSTGQCSFPWFQGPFDKETTSSSTWSAINVKISEDSTETTPGAGYFDSNTQSFHFYISDAPLQLQAGDLLCYDFTYHFQGSDIDPNQAQCNTGICSLPGNQPFVPPSVRGDPQFKGFQGQDFQVHGVSGNEYNIFSSSMVQVNGEFVFLNSGHCDKSLNTLCYGHPGSYIGELGFQFKSPYDQHSNNMTQILVRSGRYNEGLSVFYNSKEIAPQRETLHINGVVIKFLNNKRVSLDTPQLSLSIANSDRFLNLDMGLVDDKFLTKAAVATCKWPAETAPYTEPHGLMGQTWCTRKMVSSKIEGEIDDYTLEDGIFGTQFLYNKF